MTSLLVGALFLSYVFYYGRESLQDRLRFELQLQAKALESELRAMRAVAAQIASRSRIREELRRYLEGAVSQEELRAFSLPKLEDALQSAKPLVAAFRRLDPEGRELVRLGETFPGTLWPAVETQSHPRLIQTGEGRTCIAITQPIRGPAGRLLGYDQILFRAQRFISLLLDFDAQAVPGEMALVARDPKGRLVYLLGTPADRGVAAAILERLSSDSPGTAEEFLVADGEQGQEIFTVQPLEGTPGWQLVFHASRLAFHAPVIHHVELGLLVILAIFLLGGGMTVRAIRPLAGRIALEYDTLQALLAKNQELLDQAQANEARLKEAQRLTHLGNWELDLERGTLWWSDEVFHIFELDRTGSEPSYELFLDTVHPEDRERVDRAYRESVEQRTPYRVEHRLLMPDGRIKYVMERGTTFYDENGRPVRSVGTVQDVTEQEEVQERLRLVAGVFEHTADAVLISQVDGTIVDVNPAFSRILGYEREEVLGGNPRLWKSERHEREFYLGMWQALKENGYWRGEIWNRRKDGDVFPALETISSIRDSLGQVTHYVAVMTDITNLKQSQHQLEYLAHHDPLTGLPNRLLFNERLGQALLRAERHGSMLAVLFLDIDRFKHINDSLGHPFGDSLLQEVGLRLQSLLRQEDTVARLGGDEFVLLMEELARPEDAATLADKVKGLFARPFDLLERSVRVTASIGISLYPRDGTDIDTLLRNADAAMYRAKEDGRNGYCFYTEELTQEALDRVVMEHALSQALEGDEFFLVYQPQLDLKTGRVLGAEALLRWRHPEKGIVPPATFIPLAEDSGLILDIGHWVLRTACAQCRTWLDAGLDIGRMAVNVAGPQIQRGGLPEEVQMVLRETGLPAERLELEVTEGFVMGHAEFCIRQLDELRSCGVELSVDDFGTGYSSLSYLKRLPIGKLKIDRSFVRDLPANPDDLAIARAVIALGGSLGLEVIAEGVETAEQAQCLQASGCSQVQGFLYARPMPAPEFESWLRARADEPEQDASSHGK